MLLTVRLEVSPGGGAEEATLAASRDWRRLLSASSLWRRMRMERLDGVDSSLDRDVLDLEDLGL